jgi:hypothetical protein
LQRFQLIVDTVQHVEGVLLDKPVDALYVEMGASATIFRVRDLIRARANQSAHRPPE